MVNARRAPRRTAGAAAFLAVFVAGPLSAQDAEETQAVAAPPPTAVLGDVGAVLEVVEFSDFECPFCALAKPVLDALVARHGGDVRLVYRHYPLPMHAHAERAAQAAVEAARQHAFWPYHDLLFRHQERLTDVDLVGYADSLELDRDGFVRALQEGEHAEAVAADVALGRELAVTGTPTFFLNGYRVVGVPPLWVFEEAIRAFREGRVVVRPLALPRGP